VTLHQELDPYAKYMFDYMQNYAGTAEVTSNLTVQGLTALILQKTLDMQKVPISMVGDPATLMAVALLTWVYPTFNPSVMYENLSGGWVHGTVADTLRFKFTSAEKFNVFSTVFTPMSGSIYTWMQTIQLAPIYELWLDTRTVAEIDGSLNKLCSPISQSSEILKSSIKTYSTSPNSTNAVSTTGIDHFGVFGADKSAPVLIYRLTPFDADVWPTLPVTKIRNQMIVQKQLQKSDQDTYNLFWVYPNVPNVSNSNVIGEALQNQFYPVLDTASAVRYGLRELRAGLLGLERTLSPSVYVGLNEKLYHWYRLNPTYWTGNIVTGVGLPTVKVGQRVLDESSGRDYYVEGVEHDFTLFQTFKTTLTLSRGRVR
jgi:hypothetical protein